MLPAEAGGAHAGVLDHLPDTDLCEDCEEVVSDYFCNVCQCSLCADCWDRQPAHRRKRLAPGQIPHEKTELLLANRVHTVFSSATDQRTLERLHKDDEATAWFGLEREIRDGQPLMFRDHGRFAALSTSSHHSLYRQRRYSPDANPEGIHCVPSLVSFVGQTGAGKSTLIKMLIHFNQWSGRDYDFPSPIPGVTGRDLPTSEDVHLYADPITAGSEAPIFFADSEGLDGGEREPMAATFRKNRERAESESFGSESDYTPKSFTEREIAWMTTKVKRTRQFAAGQLYPRILFAFSDVVVFVHRNPRAIEGVLERLLEWGSVAIETTYNQPILPYAIIALNATESESDSELWDVQKSTRSLLDSLAGTVNRNVEFSKYADLWRKRGKKVDSVEDLMMCYYSALRIIRLPTNGRPKLIEAQAQKLYLDIERGCRLSRNSKVQARMLLNAFEFQAYLNHAFDHFCATLDSPFDFVQCSYLTTRLPTMFGQSILALATGMVKEKPRPKASTIFKKLGHLIASCIMLDVVRNNIKGSAERVFAQYVPQIDSVLKEFGDRYWPCEFFVKGAVPPHLQAHLDNMAFQQSMRAAAVILRCANVRSGHSAKGHQLSDGRVFARGAYESEFSFENDRKKVLDSVYITFYSCMENLSQLCYTGLGQLEAASKLHRENAVASFYTPKASGESTGPVYTAFCVCCLLGAPETLLSCGHMLCRNCVQAYGRRKSNTVVEVLQCPIEAHLPAAAFESQLVYFRPEVAGVRVLALTNGGIRSVIQVEIMKLIEKELNGRIPIQSLFDMVIGEGTGGALALGLIARGWDLDDCEENLDGLFKNIFAVANTHKFPSLGMKSTHAKYRAKALDDFLGSLFPREQRMIDPTTSDDPLLRNSKLSVLTSSATGRKVLFSNYRRKSLKLPYTQYPVTEHSMEPKVVDIARASMAHSSLFKPYEDPRLGPLFFKRDMSENFLIEVAQNECQAIYRGLQNGFPDVMLCIACGRSKRPTAASILSSETKKSKSSRWTRSEVGDQESYFSEDWSDACAHYPTPNFISLNPLLEEVPDLDNVSSVPRLRELIQEATDPIIISRVVAQLFATLFYAESAKPVKDTAAGETLMPVHIYCRLLDHTEEIVEVGKLLKSGPFRNADFVFWEEQYGSQQFPIAKGTIDKIIRDRTFPALRLLIPMWQPDAVLHGVLKLENGEEYPLSGFPRQLRPKATSHRPKAASEVESSQMNRASPWKAPPMPTNASWSQQLSLRPSADLYGEPGPVEYDDDAPAYDSELTALPKYSR